MAGKRRQYRILPFNLNIMLIYIDLKFKKEVIKKRLGKRGQEKEVGKKRLEKRGWKEEVGKKRLGKRGYKKEAGKKRLIIYIYKLSF